MTDEEMTTLCGQAMELSERLGRPVFEWHENGAEYFAPLWEDQHAMALVKKFKLQITQIPDGPCVVWLPRDWAVTNVENADLNRAIVECVAKMQKEKT